MYLDRAFGPAVARAWGTMAVFGTFCGSIAALAVGTVETIASTSASNVLRLQVATIAGLELTWGDLTAVGIVLAVTALFVLRRRGLPSAYRTPGYPVLPALYILCGVLVLVSESLTSISPLVTGITVFVMFVLFSVVATRWRRTADCGQGQAVRLRIVFGLLALGCAGCATTRTPQPSPAPPPPVYSLDTADAAPSLLPPQPSAEEPVVVPDPVRIKAPYSLDRVLRGFDECNKDGQRTHQAIDIAGVGPEGGLGTPVRSMVRARVTFVGRSADDPKEFGRPDRRSGTVVRGRRTLPRSRVIRGYGRVYFFTRNYGRWRSGNVIVTTGIDGPLAGHTIRYMHLSAVRPDLHRGSFLAAGEELGLMGGTAVQESAPHVHIDITTPSGDRLDVAPLLGLPGTAHPCPNQDLNTQ